jgi:putative membrane protein
MNLLTGLTLGFLGVALPLMVGDLISILLLPGECIMNSRRFTILSFAASIVYIFFLLLFPLIGVPPLMDDRLMAGFLIASGIMTFLRLLSLRVFVEEKSGRLYLAGLLQPSLCLVGANIFLNRGFGSICLIGTAILVNAIGVEALLWVMGLWREVEGIRLLTLFRAFILSWAEGFSHPLEEEIFNLGQERDLTVDTLILKAEGGDEIGVFMVPYIHPGPFGNVGSSALPEVLARSAEASLGCETLVAHGVSTHRLDLTRSIDNTRIAEQILGSIPQSQVVKESSPLIWVKRCGVEVTCQVIGNVALLTITLSPLSYDDLPEQLLDEIQDVASSIGLRAIVVDCHNSIDFTRGLDNYDETRIIDVVREALERANDSHRWRFEAAVARCVPWEWGLDEGIGPMGVSVLAMRIEGGGLFAHVVVDGNNMVTGLRERLVGALKDVGFDGVEVMTSDIHTVNGIGSTQEGYFPIGERMEWGRLVEYIVETAEEAALNLQSAGVLAFRTVVPKLTVLGEGGLDTLQRILESGFSLFVRAGLLIFLTCLFASVAIGYLLGSPLIM